MAIEISFAVQFPETVEISVPVVMEGRPLGYPAVLRTAEVTGAGVYRRIERDEEGRKTLVTWYSMSPYTVHRMDMYQYANDYIILQRIGSGSIMTIRTDTKTGRSEVIGGSGDAMDPAAVQAIIQSSPGERSLPIGTEISLPWTSEDGTVYDNRMVLVDYQYMTVEEDPDGDPVWMGIFWNKRAALHKMQYDAPERERRTETTAANGYKYYMISSHRDAYNRVTYETAAASSASAGSTIPASYIYKYQSNYLAQPIVGGSPVYSRSAVHKYLNSDAAEGEWWSRSGLGDAAPLNADTTRGYLAGFSESDLARIRSVRVSWKEPSRTSSSADPTTVTRFCRFWLPSQTELYMIADDGSGAEGAAWEEYWQGLGLVQPITGSIARAVSRIDQDGGEGVDYWTRSSCDSAEQYYVDGMGRSAHKYPGRGGVSKKDASGQTYQEVENIEKYLVPVCAIG